LSGTWTADPSFYASLGGIVSKLVGFHLVLKSAPREAQSLSRFSDVATVFCEVVGYHFALAFS
jgi:hypothetical protein